MTAVIVYHNSNGETIDMDTNDLTWDYDFHNKNIYPKSNKARSVVHDPNRVLRVFTWSCLLSRANMDKLHGYLQPTAATTYDTGYPKIVWTKDATPTTETVLGAIIACSEGMATSQTDAQYRVKIVFKERFYPA